MKTAPSRACPTLCAKVVRTKGTTSAAAKATKARRISTFQVVFTALHLSNPLDRNLFKAHKSNKARKKA